MLLLGRLAPDAPTAESRIPKGSVTAVEYLDDLRKASSDAGLAALLESARAPFDRAEWWEGLARHCGLAPLYAVARGHDAMALLPLQASSGTITPLANWYTFRWRPLVTPGTDPAPLLEAIARDLRKRGWRASFRQVPDEDGSATALAAAFRAAGWQVQRAVDDSNHVQAAGGCSYAEYLASRPGPLRTTLKRKTGKVSCIIYHDFQEDIWDSYEDIYSESWKPSEGSPAFLREFARAEGAAGRLRLGLATVGSRPVAAQFWTVEGNTAFIHKLAHREDARAQSPGSVLSAALFAEVIDVDRVTLIDFGTGDDSYKRDWMDDVRPRYRIEALNPGSPRAWPQIARKTLHRLVASRKRG
ncbi:MAG: GNAT family N-acetyltransferase [Sphingomonadales bacterium]|nr:GNAT family N-acetyltransferase [Sphingomonadales bacterium]MBU3990972.1 GNAT family N-acetyltransferase [Alphaproteobacteria bacterium]